MTDAPDREFRSEVARIGGELGQTLSANPLRAGQRYPLQAVLPVVGACHDRLQALVAAHAGPVAASPDGTADAFGAELAGLMSHLQGVRVLYHGLDDIPEGMRAAAGRSLSALHLAARRVLDAARRSGR